MEPEHAATDVKMDSRLQRMILIINSLNVLVNCLPCGVLYSQNILNIIIEAETAVLW